MWAAFPGLTPPDPRRYFARELHRDFRVMANDPEREKLDNLTARIHAAEGKPIVQDEPVAPLKFSRVGFDFVGSVLGCALIGWLLDKYLGTGPWGVMIMVLVGFCVGTFNVWRSWSGPKTE